MSRLRRLVLCDRYFFVTCKVLPQREWLSEADFALLTDSVQSRRTQHHFLLTAWVFLPDHWHAIVMPPYPSTISGVMESINVSCKLFRIMELACGTNPHEPKTKPVSPLDLHPFETDPITASTA